MITRFANHKLYILFNRFGPDVTSFPLKIINEGSYSKVNVQELGDTLNEFEITSEKITFPVRAGLLTSSESQGNIISLLSQVFFFF